MNEIVLLGHPGCELQGLGEVHVYTCGSFVSDMTS